MREGRAVTHNSSKLLLEEVQGIWLETEHTLFSSMSSESVAQFLAGGEGTKCLFFVGGDLFAFG